MRAVRERESRRYCVLRILRVSAGEAGRQDLIVAVEAWGQSGFSAISQTTAAATVAAGEDVAEAGSSHANLCHPASERRGQRPGRIRMDSVERTFTRSEGGTIGRTGGGGTGHPLLYSRDVARRGGGRRNGCNRAGRTECERSERSRSQRRHRVVVQGISDLRVAQERQRCDRSGEQRGGVVQTQRQSVARTQRIHSERSRGRVPRPQTGATRLRRG